MYPDIPVTGDIFIPSISPADTPHHQLLRQHMVEHLVREGPLVQPAIVQALLAIPRHRFVPSVTAEQAYQDEAIATLRDGEMQPIVSSSQPSMMAIMLQQLDIHPGMRILEIGTGTGYNAALLAYLVGPQGHVYSVDIEPATVTSARLALAGLPDLNERVSIEAADGMHGWPDAAPFDRIIVTAGVWDIPPAWFAQIRTEGVMVVPLAIHTVQYSFALMKHDSLLEARSTIPCRFIRLRGPFAGNERFLSLPDGTRMMTEATAVAEQTNHIAAALASKQSYTRQLPPQELDGIRYYLPFAEPALMTCIQKGTQHSPALYSHGLMAEQEASLAFVTPHGYLAAWGTRSANRRLSTHLARWRELGAPPVDRWRITAYPAGDTPDSPKDMLTVRKQHWTITARLDH